jgi:ABC-type transporter Mla subunit MlaD
MNKRTIQEILAQLRQELRRAEDIDPDSRRRTEELHRELEGVAEDEGDFQSLRDRARELETQFAAEHPTLERIARELADALAKMGV